MRCLLVSDIHYELAQFNWVLSIADEFDVVVLAGDMLDLSSAVDYRAQSLVVRRYLRRLGAVAHIVMCSGNHDLDARGTNGEKTARWIAHLREAGVVCDGRSLLFEDNLFTVCPWWDGPAARERLTAQVAADAPRRPRRWIWVHHAPPANSPTSWASGRSQGDDYLSGLIGEFHPDMVLCGHIHQSPFIKDGSWADRLGETWVFNAGHQYGAPPAHVVIDTAEGEAVWMSAMGAQAVRLGEPLGRPIPALQALPDWFPAETPRDNGAVDTRMDR